MSALTPRDGLDRLAPAAAAGDRLALEGLVRGLRDDVHGLAVRMLWHPQDAEDATQEILIKVIAGLGGFRGGSSVRTWAYRIAANHLLTTRARRMERPELSFDAFAADLADGNDLPYDHGGVEAGLLAAEVKIGCTQGMLLCLDREHRLAYVLGEILELQGPQAADVAGVSPATFRKRLERARSRIRTFVEGNCGLADSANPCRCSRRVGAATACGRVDPRRLLFADRDIDVAATVRQLDAMQDVANLFRSNPPFLASDDLTRWLRDLLDGRESVLAG